MIYREFKPHYITPWEWVALWFLPEHYADFGYTTITYKVWRGKMYIISENTND